MPHASRAARALMGHKGARRAAVGFRLLIAPVVDSATNSGAPLVVGPETSSAALMPISVL
jgi:hypothetical protein